MLRLTQKNTMLIYKKPEIVTELLNNDSICVVTWHSLNIRIKLETDLIEYKIQSKYSKINM